MRRAEVKTVSHMVEIRHIGTNLDASIGELQNWLNSRGVRPVALEHSSGGPGITFRVHFSVESEALAFAETFKGRLCSGAHPGGAALWALPVLDQLDEITDPNESAHRPCVTGSARPSGV
jgi:hypothetical protein